MTCIVSEACIRCKYTGCADVCRTRDGSLS